MILNHRKNVVTFFFGTVMAFALTACFSSDPVSGEQLLDLKPGDPAGITVDELIGKMRTATDPSGEYRRARSYALIQNVESIDGKTRTAYSTEILYKAPGLIRQISKKDGKPFTIILYRFGKAWYINPKTNKPQIIPEGTALNMVQAFMSMLNPRTSVREIFRSVDLDIAGREGTKYYRMICRTEDPDIAPYIFYVDRETFLTKRFETVLYGADGTCSLYIALSEDYAWFGKVRMAKRSIISVNDKTDISKITTFRLNPEIADSVFNLPSKK